MSGAREADEDESSESPAPTGQGSASAAQTSAAAQQTGTNAASESAIALNPAMARLPGRVGGKLLAGWNPAPPKSQNRKGQPQLSPDKSGINETATAPVELHLTPPPPTMPVVLPLESLNAGAGAQPSLTEVPQKTQAAGQTTPPAASAAPKSEMAFAARVQPANASSETVGRQHNPQEPQATAAASNLRKASTADTNSEESPAPATPAQAPAAAVAAVYQAGARAAEPAASTSAPDGAQAPASAAVAAPAAPPQHPTTPLRDISLQVSQPGAAKVEVRVMQQAGEVRVAVKTGDSDLASGLRQNVHELVGRLEDNGYHAEAWRPGGASSLASIGISQPADSHGAAFQSPGGQSQSQNGQSQQQSGGSQGRQGGSQQDGDPRNQNSSNRPRWVEELESSVRSTGNSTGENHGIRN